MEKNLTKADIIAKYGQSATDTGSPEVQIAMLTSRITDLKDHFAANPKDFHSRKGLLQMVGRRKNLLKYLKNVDIERYRAIISKLELRK